MRGRVIIVGAGASGITTCKEFSEAGYECIAFERDEAHVGGVFRDAYKGIQLTSSTALTSFSDFPAKENPPKMWTGPEYLDYLKQYAERFDVLRCIRFGCEVTSIERTHGGSQGYWKVTVRQKGGTFGSKCFVEYASLLVLTTGTHTKPVLPSFDGSGAFSGKIIHSSEIRGFDVFAGQRVVTIGVGESGSDIPLFICQHGATSVHISCRGVGWVFPRTRPRKGGLPADLATNRLLWGLPRYMNGVLSYLMASGDAKKDEPVLKMMGETNLRHPSGVYKTYGTKSSSFLEAVVEHGAVLKPQVRSLGPGKRVVFTDGTEIEADILVCSTGFGPPGFTSLLAAGSADGLLKRVLDDASTSVRHLYKRAVHPELPDRLFWVGFARPQHGSIPPIAELQARSLAASLSGHAPALPESGLMRSIIRQDKLREERLFDGAARRVGALADHLFLINDLAQLLGARPPFLRLLWEDPKLLVRLFGAVHSTAQFRLAGPGSDAGRAELARSTIRSYPLVWFRRRHAISLALYTVAMLVVGVVALAFPVPTPWMQALCPVGFGYLKRRSLASRLVHAALVCALLAALSTLLALLYALAMGATTLLHDVLDEDATDDAAEAYVVLPAAKQFSTATNATQGEGSAVKRLIRKVVLANRATKQTAPSVDPDLVGKPEPEVAVIMARREKSYEDQDQPW